MLKKTLALTALAASVTAFAPAGEAEAGKRLRIVIGHGHHWHHHHHLRYYDPCHYYYKKWKWTGKRHWKKKYYECIY